MKTLVLLRHGESDWNAKGLFTGWVDVGLSETGAQEAVNGGRLLAQSGIRPYTAGQGQGRDQAGVRRRAVHAVAPLL